MNSLESLFKEYQEENKLLIKAKYEKRVTSISTIKYRIGLIESESVKLSPSSIEIISLFCFCGSVEDYLFINILFYQKGDKGNLRVVYEILLKRLDIADDLIKVGQQMISFGLQEGFDFIDKANQVSNNEYDRVLVQGNML